MNYLLTIAEEISQELDPSLIPPEDAEKLMVLYALLCISIGGAVSRRNVHDAWNAWMLQRGADHPAMIPFELLPEGVQSADQPFVDAIRAVSARTVAT